MAQGVKFVTIGSRWVAVLLMVPLAGCAGSNADRDGPVVLPSADTTTSLTVTVSDGTAERSYTVECDPAGGTHPRPESACEFLELAGKWGQDPFATPPDDAVCAQVYGGPQTAAVSGRWRGRDVDARFSRTDSCQIQRWDNAVALLAVRTGDTGAGGIEPRGTPGQ
jgi:hypothetical protein